MSVAQRTPPLAVQHTLDLGECIAALAWSPDGRTLAAASLGGPVFVIDAETGAVRHELAGHALGTAALAWHPDGRLLASAGMDGRVRRWLVWTGDEYDVLEVGQGWVEQLAFSDSGTYLAAAAGRQVRCFDIDGALLHDWQGHTSTVTALRWRPGAEELATAAYGGILRWRPGAPAPVQRHEWKGSVLTIEWSPDARFIATGDQDSTMHFWMVESGRSLQMWGYPTKVQHLAWDPGSRFLATGGSEAVTIWDCVPSPEGTTPAMHEGHDKVVSALAWQHDGPLLLSGGRDGRLLLWHPQRHREPLARVSGRSPVNAVAWHPDDDAFAAGAEDGTLLIVPLPVGH